jgi:hypothetical protein
MTSPCCMSACISPSVHVFETYDITLLSVRLYISQCSCV